MAFMALTAISTFFVLPEVGILPVILTLNLNESEYLLCYNLEYLSFTSLDFLMFLHNYRCALKDYISAVQDQHFSIIYLGIIYFAEAIKES